MNNLFNLDLTEQLKHSQGKQDIFSTLLMHLIKDEEIINILLLYDFPIHK